MKQWVMIAAVVGVLNPNCTLEQVCVPGFTKTIRPPVSYTNKLKAKQMAERGLPGDPSQYEEDHIIPLELCGNPTDPNNLTPQLWDRARKKDVMESKFHRAVCAGKIKLEDAQKQIVTFE